MLVTDIVDCIRNRELRVRLEQCQEDEAAYSLQLLLRNVAAYLCEGKVDWMALSDPVRKKAKLAFGLQ
jgi:hypothetical protein